MNGRVTEAAWVNGLRQGTEPYSKVQLKKAVYGTDRPALTLAVQRAKEEASRVADNLHELEQLFPGGFGTFATSVRGWATVP